MDALRVSVEPVAGGHALCLERRFEQPRERVWAALTESAQMATWLAPGEIEPWIGGRVLLQFAGSGTVVDSALIAFAPHTLLEYNWATQDGNTGPVRWELASEKEGTTLVLTHFLPAPNSPARTVAAWHMHFELLGAALNEQPASWSQGRYKELREHYLQVAGS